MHMRTSNGRGEGTTRGAKNKRSEESSEAILKKPKQDTTTSSSKMNNKGGGGRGKGEKILPTKGKCRMIPPRKLEQQNILRRNLINTRPLDRSSPPVSQPLVPTQTATPTENVAAAQTPSPIHASTPGVFMFMPTPGINLQTMSASSQQDPHEASVANDDVSDQDEEVEDHDEEESGDEDQDDEAQVGERSFPPHIPERDGEGKVKIQPFGKGLIPGKEVADAIREAIQTQFRKPIYDWSQTTKKIRDDWFERFGKKVSWDPSLTGIVRLLFEQKAKKRLSDMLTKYRKKNAKPGWMGEKAWLGLLDYWKKPKFKEISERNKINRASTRGGAVHTSGRKAHIDLALELCHEKQGDVAPDELFLKTHKKKSGAWVDHRAETTYDTFKKNVVDLVGDDDQSVDGAVALDCWKLAAGGPNRGRLYGTAGLCVNVKPGSKSLIQPSQNPLGFMIGISLKEERAARLKAEKMAQEARAQAEVATQEAREANERARKLEARMDALERKSGGGSCASHPHYDDDLDEDSEHSD